MRYSAATGITLTGTGHTMNALLVDSNSATAAFTVAGSGATDSLAVKSGAFIFASTVGTAQPVAA